MAIRLSKAEGEWVGALKDGKGTMKLGSGPFTGAFSVATRFDQAAGTNPEELIGAAHAGCYSMMLVFLLGEKGYKPTRVRTGATVHMDPATFKLTKIELSTEAEVPGIDARAFMEQAELAKKNCPVSQSLNPSIEITLKAKLA